MSNSDENKEESGAARDSRRAFLSGAAVAGAASVLGQAAPASADEGNDCVLDRDKMHEIIGKYLLHADFRAAFISNPANAVAEAGIALTTNELNQVLSIQTQLDAFSADPNVVAVSGFVQSYIDRVIQA